MIARDRALGAIALVSARAERVYGDADLALASELATRAALAIDNVRLYQEARAANQTKSELLAVISHDLRTPLSSIIGYVQLLEMGLPEPLPDPCRKPLGRIHVSARHLLYLIDELLTYARIESGPDDARLQEVDIGALVQEVGAIMEPLAAERELQLHVVLPPAPLSLHTDPDKLRQVLMNLLTNAHKFTPAGEITIAAARKRGGDVVIEVRDCGIGIAPEHLPHVFEPFWQVDRSQRTRGGGTGLGLSIVQRVVQQLGGTINVVSSPGKGSTFTVTLRAT
jgi:signal transduction histidine kinase